MTALSTAEAVLRRAPDDPGVPVTLTGAEAAALVAELDGLRERGDEVVAATRAALDGVGFNARLDGAVGQWQAAREVVRSSLPEREYADRPALIMCPTCGSAQPHLHPSRDLCPDLFHRPVPANVTEWRREAARWADLLDSMEFDAPGGTGAVDRLAAEIRREVRESGPGGRRDA